MMALVVRNNPEIKFNRSIDTDLLLEGFARPLSAGHLQLQGLPHLCQTQIHRG